MEEVLQDDVRLSHSGAAVFDNAHTNPNLTNWHVHYAWDIPDGGLQREISERILCNIYVDGSSLDVGPLIVLPRQLNESVDGKDDVSVDWEGQDVVEVPPGAAVILTLLYGIAPVVGALKAYAASGVGIIRDGIIRRPIPRTTPPTIQP